MKKLILPVVAIFALASFSSCKKDYTRKCTVTASGSSTTTTITIANSSKSDAKAACENAQTTVGGVTSTCALD